MPCREDDDKPFNPFYIGPHPSQACASAQPESTKCSPSAQTGNQPSQGIDSAAAAAATTSGAGTAAGGTAGPASGSGPASSSASVAGATDETVCPLGKQANNGGNVENAENAESTGGNAGGGGTAGGTTMAAAVPTSPARRSADSINHDDQKNGHAGAANTTVNTGTSLPGNSNVAGGLLIVGMAGPTGGVATIYSTGQVPTGSVAPPVPSTEASQAQATPPKQSEEQPQQQADEQKPCPTYPCMERKRD